MRDAVVGEYARGTMGRRGVTQRDMREERIVVVDVVDWCALRWEYAGVVLCVRAGVQRERWKRALWDSDCGLCRGTKRKMRYKLKKKEKRKQQDELDGVR